MFADLFRVVAEYELGVPAEIAAVSRCLGTLEGTPTQLAPGFDMVAEARAFIADRLAEQLQPGSLRRTATEELLSTLPLLRRLPRRLDRISAALEEGRLTVNTRPFADDGDRRLLTGLIHHVLLAGLSATAGIMAVLLLGLSGGPAVTTQVSLYELLGYGLLVISAILALRVLAVVFRPGRH